MSLPIVSVIIPCKNAEQWLAETIRSCLSQTWQPLEIIVIDNGSTDRSLEIANSFKSSGVRVLECEKPGAAAARNVGLQAASGEYIQFLDADDILAPTKIEIQVQRLSGDDPFAVAICPWGVFSDSLAEAVMVESSLFCDQDPIDYICELWLTRSMMASLAYLCPRGVIEKAGPWNENLSLEDDGEFFARVVLASNRVRCCSQAKGFYRITAMPSLNKRRDVEALTSAYRACEFSARNLLKKQDCMETRRAAAARYQYFVHLVFPRVPELVKKAEQSIYSLGHAPTAPSWSGKLYWCSQLLGWKATRRLQALWLSAKLRVAHRIGLEHRAAAAAFVY